MAYHHHLQRLPSHEDESVYLADLAYTLSEKRSLLTWKSFAVANSLDQLIQSLGQGLTKPVRSMRSPKIGFVFTGQGAQWYAMGRELLDHPVFRESLENAGSTFRNLGSTWLIIGTFYLPLLPQSISKCIKMNS
jgi:acyl transferase domain-containing protein